MVGCCACGERRRDGPTVHIPYNYKVKPYGKAYGTHIRRTVSTNHEPNEEYHHVYLRLYVPLLRTGRIILYVLVREREIEPNRMSHASLSSPFAMRSSQSPSSSSGSPPSPPQSASPSSLSRPLASPPSSPVPSASACRASSSSST